VVWTPQDLRQITANGLKKLSTGWTLDTLPVTQPAASSSENLPVDAQVAKTNRKSIFLQHRGSEKTWLSR